jgi:hypothetical protein
MPASSAAATARTHPPPGVAMLHRFRLPLFCPVPDIETRGAHAPLSLRPGNVYLDNALYATATSTLLHSEVTARFQFRTDRALCTCVCVCVCWLVYWKRRCRRRPRNAQLASFTGVFFRRLFAKGGINRSRRTKAESLIDSYG